MNILTVILASAISLCGSWQFRCTSPEGEWNQGMVPGCVHTDLLSLGMIQDPFYGDNEKRLQWIGEKDWEYARTFNVTAADLAQSHVELVFEGLDTYASVYVNDVLVLSSDNMFRTWKVDVRDILKEGENSIAVRFESVFKRNISKYLDAPFKLQAWPNNDRADIWLSLYSRKAGYNYGWDWGPRLITTGIWKPVHIDCWSGTRIEPSRVATASIEAKKAVMASDVNVYSDENCDAVIEIFADGKRCLRKSCTLSAGANTIPCQFDVKNPQLWWCNGMGEHKVYEFEIRLTSGQSVTSRVEKAGIRTLEIVREKDEQGTSMFVRLNGKPVFAKGANWVPQDNFPCRVTPERYQAAVKDAVDANMNMLRVWGGGLYENDVFYDECDRNGILVWQDMAFACGMFPYDQDFLDNVSCEVRDNVRRLRNHPSIALWCGNNENEISYFAWGWNNTITAEQRREYEAGLHRLFYEVIPQAIAVEDPERYYHPSSPVTGYSGIDYSQGDAHYWGVWKGSWVEDYLKPHNIARFMSEYGFQAYPCMETIRSFCPDYDMKVGSRTMLMHQKAYDDETRDPNYGDNMMLKYMNGYYKVPEAFEDFIYLSQYQQAEAVKVAMEAHRRAKPYCMGTLFWQINDCWPVASWSSVDYYGRWKALQYYARRAYEETIASPYIAEDGKVAVRIVTDSRTPVKATLELYKVAFDGAAAASSSIDVVIPADASLDACILGEGTLAGFDLADEEILYVRLVSSRGLLSDNVFFKGRLNTHRLDAPKPDFQAAAIDGGVALSIGTASPLLGLHLDIDGVDQKSISDNWMDIIPGFRKTIEIHTSLSPEELLENIEYKYINHILQ